jgi:glycosyltransferase involved in cell wall biosynthesis
MPTRLRRCRPGARSPTAADLELSVIIPAYNEAANLRGGVLSRVSGFLRPRFSRFEVLVVDDGSVDDTVALAERHAAADDAVRVVRSHHGGKAHALVTGLRAARGRVVLFSDMDQAIPIDEAAKLLPWFDRGFDIVVGSRGLERRHAGVSRRIVSLGQLVARLVVLGFADITDTQCGFKALRRDIAVPLVERLVVYGAADEQTASGPALAPGFDVELLFVAKRLGLTIKEVTIECDHRRRGAETRLLRECVRGIRDLVAIRSASMRGRYGRPFSVGRSTVGDAGTHAD